MIVYAGKQIIRIRHPFSLYLNKEITSELEHNKWHQARRLGWPQGRSVGSGTDSVNPGRKVPPDHRTANSLVAGNNQIRGFKSIAANPAVKKLLKSELIQIKQMLL